MYKFNFMNTLTREEISVSIAGDIAGAIQRHYEKEVYSLMVENFFKYLLPGKRECNGALSSSRLRGCASIVKNPILWE
jgi:hypothetical protein